MEPKFISSFPVPETCFFGQIRVATIPLGLCVLLTCCWKVEMPEFLKNIRSEISRRMHEVARLGNLLDPIREKRVR